MMMKFLQLSCNDESWHIIMNMKIEKQNTNLGNLMSQKNPWLKNAILTLLTTGVGYSTGEVEEDPAWRLSSPRLFLLASTKPWMLGIMLLTELPTCHTWLTLSRLGSSSREAKIVIFLLLLSYATLYKFYILKLSDTTLGLDNGY